MAPFETAVPCPGAPPRSIEWAQVTECNWSGPRLHDLDADARSATSLMTAYGLNRHDHPRRKFRRVGRAVAPVKVKIQSASPAFGGSYSLFFTLTKYRPPYFSSNLIDTGRSSSIASAAVGACRDGLTAVEVPPPSKANGRSN